MREKENLECVITKFINEPALYEILRDGTLAAQLKVARFEVVETPQARDAIRMSIKNKFSWSHEMGLSCLT
jgi:hypothetical protein